MHAAEAGAVEARRANRLLRPRAPARWAPALLLSLTPLLATLLLMGALLWSAPARAAAPPLSPPLQAELDAAVADYAAGRHAQALQAMQSLSDRRVPAADYNLGLMHLKREVPQPDRATAERLLVRAAEAGFVTAQALLGQAYETGQIGPQPGQKDLERAHHWYEVAGMGGSVDSQVAMGTAYFLGRGRPKNLALALQWYREAAKGGDVGAMYLTASMYEHGDGVEPDLRLARYWYQQAARQGDEAAPGKLKEVEGKIANAAGA
jgi:TPR repeat protein